MVIEENIIPILDSNENELIKLTVNNKNANDEPYKVFDRSINYNNRSFWYSTIGYPYWFNMEFKTHKVCIAGYSVIASWNYTPHSWQLKGSNDGVNWDVVDTQINQSNILKDNVKHIYICNGTLNYYSIYRFDFTKTSDNNIMIIEMEVYEANIYKYIFKKENKYYTIKNDELTLLEDQNLNKDNFKTNGFDDLELMNNIDKIDMKLLIYDESNPDKLKLKYTLKEPFRPIDKFKGKIKILKQEMK